MSQANAVPDAPRRVLPVLVIAQFIATSSWFAVNAVMPELQAAFSWPASDIGALTSAVQLGFIFGTLVFTLLSIADRFSARRVFLLCSLSQAACTIAAVHSVESFWALWTWRAMTGFFLAGIYPVGMKIAAQWFPNGLGSALGFLVGALVLGSASPHALRALSVGLPWQNVFYFIALLAALAGIFLYWLIPEPRHIKARATGLKLSALWLAMAEPKVRASVLGYFGHMWELYSLWVLTPMILATRLASEAVSWNAFAVLGAGALGCVLGGRIAIYRGGAVVAATLLAISGLCCLLAPWMLEAPIYLFMAWMLVWGFTVSSDSPQFSALTASSAPAEWVGSALTLSYCIGFAISIVSIQLFVFLAQTVPLAQLLPWLGIGPILGLIALRPLLRTNNAT